MGSVRQVVNAGGVWGGQPGWANPNAAILGSNDQLLLQAINNSAVTLTHGDLVIVDTAAAVMPAVSVPPGTPQSGGYAVTTTTVAKSPLVLGVVSMTGDASTAGGTVNIGQSCQICIAGVARVNVASGAAVGGAVQASGVAKQGLANAALAAGDIGTIIGICLEAYAARDANNTIRCLIRAA